MTKIARRRFLKGVGVAGIGAASASVAAPAIAQSMPEIKWRMTASWPKSLDTLYGGAEHICKRVAAMTDNKFQIQPFAAGEIVPGLQVLDAVQNGTVECGHTALYYYFGKDDSFVFGSALGVAFQVGLGTLPLYAALGLAFSFGQALLELIRNPALGLTQPLLALLAFVLLVWPRQLISQRSTPS